MNLFKRFQRLLPNPPLRVGRVVGYSDGVADIEEAGGGIARARGEATVNQMVFFRDNTIEGSAPELTVELIEV